MTRIIRPGPRPAIALGLMATIFSTVVLYGAITQQRWDLVEGWLFFMAILSVVIMGIYSVRIEVTDDHISRLNGFWSTQTLRFDQIDHSVPRALAERNHPLWLDIYSKKQGPKSTTLRLPLKSCREADVSWLMSLEALRIRR